MPQNQTFTSGTTGVGLHGPISKKSIVLLVDDNPSDRELVTLALKPLGVTVVEAEDGNEAVDYLFRQNKFSAHPTDEVPDLILLDLRMPKRDGLAVLHFIRGVEDTRHTPVVILSSFGNPEILAAAKAYRTV